MAGYRAQTPVIAAKSVLQPALRMGVLSQAEDAFPGYQGGGFELSNIGAVEELQSGLFTAMNNPLFMPLEVLIAPYNIFTPGTFVSRAGDVGALNKIGRGAFAAFGTAGGRAAAGAAIGSVLGTAAGDDAGDTAKGALLGGIGGALLPVIGKGLSSDIGGAAATIGLGAGAGALMGDDPTDIALGALAGIGLVALPGSARASFLDQLGSNGVTRLLKKTGDAFQLTSFKPLAEEQFATLGLHSGMRRALQDRADFFADRPDFLGDAPDALTAWDGHVDRLGVLGALAKLQGGDTETAAATIGFVFTSSAGHWVANAQAGEHGSKGWWNRYHAAKNKLTNQLRRPTDLDNITPSTIDDLADAMAWTEKGAHGPANLPAVYRRARELRDQMMADPGRVLEFAADHERQAAETVQQLMHPTNVPKLDDVAAFSPDDDSVKALRDLIGEGWASETTESRAWIMQKYMSQNDIFDTLVDYPKFATITGELRDARTAGLFEAATLKQYKDRFGASKAVRRGREAMEQPELTKINAAVSDRLLSDTLDVSRLPNTRVSPLASQGNPGRVTVARIGTPLEGDYRELGERIRDLKDVQDHWRRLPTKLDMDVIRSAEGLKDVPTKPDFESALDGLGVDATTKMSDLAEAQFSQLIQTVKGKKALGYVLGYARRHKLSMADVDTAVTRSVDELLGDSKMWKDMGFGEYVMDEQGRGLYGMEALSKRLQEVNLKAANTAAEVDMEDLARYLRETGDEAGAVRVEQLSENLGRDGYKAAHGVEFLMPEDLAHGPMFQDVTRRHLNAATLGN
ncbi:MAG: hypothetical protein H0U13_01455, partial [Gemmatimonadaceae bacterium]|nr:hypothetical protein [Gemmatimonadaceae bacterium]